MPNIKLDKQHFNYLIIFSDGIMKIGTTCRIKERIKEVRKEKKNNNSILDIYISNLQTKENALRAERDTCYLLKYLSIKNKREWMKSRGDGDFHYVKKTLEMFISGLLLKRSSSK